MKREFIEVEIFNKLWEKLGLSDENLKDLQEFLCINPDAGDVLQKTNGVRKLRWTIGNKGKRGGVRVLYIDFVIFEKIYLLTVYKKGKKEDISENEKKLIRQLVDVLKNELKAKNEKK